MENFHSFSEEREQNEEERKEKISQIREEILSILEKLNERVKIWRKKNIKKKIFVLRMKKKIIIVSETPKKNLKNIWVEKGWKKKYKNIFILNFFSIAKCGIKVYIHKKKTHNTYLNLIKNINEFTLIE